jgi:hypothetical protein
VGLRRRLIHRVLKVQKDVLRDPQQLVECEDLDPGEKPIEPGSFSTSLPDDELGSDQATSGSAVRTPTPTPEVGRNQCLARPRVSMPEDDEQPETSYCYDRESTE